MTFTLKRDMIGISMYVNSIGVIGDWRLDIVNIHIILVNINGKGY